MAHSLAATAFGARFVLDVPNGHYISEKAGKRQLKKADADSSFMASK
ncbi:MAG: hypothetical protein ABSF86_22470 [Steroidobacteraceae bacterium]|jgi:hypothetical protein